jgi:hypothetical protein
MTGFGGLLLAPGGCYFGGNVSACAHKLHPDAELSSGIGAGRGNANEEPLSERAKVFGVLREEQLLKNLRQRSSTSGQNV